MNNYRRNYPFHCTKLVLLSLAILIITALLTGCIPWGPFDNPRENGVDIELSSLAVTRPTDTSLRTVTACSFSVKNYGPTALTSEVIQVDYYLSTNGTYETADDKKIGDTTHTVSVNSGNTIPITLNSTELANMYRLWDEDLVPAGNFYVFAVVSIVDDNPNDTTTNNNSGRTTGTFTYAPVPVADLTLTSLTVTRPTDTSLRTFTACNFSIKNNGPTGLVSESVRVDYYLSTNSTYETADDKKIGDTTHTVSINSGNTIPITLNSTELANMYRLWDEDLVPAGNYYVIAVVSIVDGNPNDTTPGNDYARTTSAVSYASVIIADLELTSLAVTRPTDTSLRTFTACSFSVKNNGPTALTSEVIQIDYYLSTNSTYEISVDKKIGDTTHTVSINSGNTIPITLSSTGLTNMYRLWDETLVPAGNFYVFAVVSIVDDNPNDTTPGNDYTRTAGTFAYAPIPIADLTLTSLTVTRPTDTSLRTFTACSFSIKNNGPTALASESVRVDYYLSTNSTYETADDKKIGDTTHTVTIASGATYSRTLNSTELSSMYRLWDETLVPAGNYYVFAVVSIVDDNPNDTTPGNDYTRTTGTFAYAPIPVADLTLTSLTVTRPTDTSLRTFTACSFSVKNNGPTALASESVRVDYYLSDNDTYNSTDDKKIGDTTFTLSINSGATYPIGLSSTGLSNMCRLWDESLVPVGNYYIFAVVSIVDSNPDDTTTDNDYDRAGPFSYTNPPADLGLTSLTVTRPSNPSLRSFTACTFTIVNNGPTALSSEVIQVDFYLSSDTTYGDTDDKKIGDITTSVSIDSEGSQALTLTPLGLTNMVDLWTPELVPIGDYYVFAAVSIIDDNPFDPRLSNNHDRTDSTFNYTGPYTTLFSDGFEDAFPGSWFVGNNTGITTSKWGDNAFIANSGAWSIFCADNGSYLRSTYDNNLCTYIQRREISLEGYTSARLQFYLIGYTEASKDIFEVNIKSQSGVWTNKLTKSGDFGSWTLKTIDLNGYVGQTNLTVSFDFISNGSVVPSGNVGVWIDDVVLQAY